MRRNKHKKKRELLESEGDDEQMRLRLNQLLMEDMEHDHKMRSEAIHLSRKREKQVDSWVI